MISWMQKHRKYLVVTIWISTIAFVAAGSMGWGAYSPGSGKSDVIAKVGSIDITNRDFQSTHSRIFNYYNQMLGGKLTKEKAKSLKIEDIALEQLFNNTLIQNYAKDLGIVVSDEEAVQELLTIEAFQTNGQFSQKKYEELLVSLNTSANEFEANIKKDLARKKLFVALNLPITDLEKKLLYSSIYIQDKLKLKVIDSKNLKVELKEEEIKKYWESNKQRYMSQKSYLLDIVKVDASTIEVEDSDLKKLYSEKKFLFKGEDGKILDFDKAKEMVVKQVQMKKAKSSILKKYLKFKSSKLKADESITVTDQNSLFAMEKVHGAKVGEYIRSIKTDTGYISALLKEVKEPKILKFEDAKIMATNDFKTIKEDEALEKLAKENLDNLDGAKELDFINRDDFEKLDMFSKDEAVEFLNSLFSKNDSKGYHIFSDKIAVYEIVSQKIFDKKKFDEVEEKLEDSLKNLKNRSIEGGLVKKLKTMYKIEKYYKVKG
ncbi:MAG TPA: hypothetical protein EYG69_03495 [Campylobacterales bacterium]|nr:hypothetical protein [Campylobacterales bacterium]